MRRIEFDQQLELLKEKHEDLLLRRNVYNGIYDRYKYPILTAEHTPLVWKYDFNFFTNPNLLQRIGINATLNSGAIYHNGKYNFHILQT